MLEKIMLFTEEKYRRIGITGHRPDKLGREYDYKGPYSDYIREELRKIILEHTETENYVSGMALGVDTIFAELILYYNKPLVAAIPFRGQEKHWPEQSQVHYKRLMMNKLIHPHYVSEGDFTHKKMQIRNEWVVNNCDLLIAVFDGTHGGTGNCVEYAKSINHPIIYIDPKLAIK